MKPGAITIVLFTAVLVSALPVSADAPREDAIWARVASGPITLDGVLDEPSWAQAETKSINMLTDNGIPGSGYKFEGGIFPRDPTRATLRFLTYGNALYMGAEVPDSSIGGSTEFNRFDAFLMSLKNHTNSLQTSKPPAEYFYTWWQPDSTMQDPQPAGADPIFIGHWAQLPWGSPRSTEDSLNWNAVTVVDGLTNDDSVIDQGYTVEMMFNLDNMGYDVTQPGGDVLEWNISIYDCDWFWPVIPKFAANRVWWQSPWGNDNWYNEVRIHADPTVTVNSGPVPQVGPELVIPWDSGGPPVIDGSLSDPVWSSGIPYSFDITFGDTLLRASYPGIGPHRSGQYQPLIPTDTVRAPVIDPGDATVKLFTHGDFLYMGFDVRDLVVQYHPDINRWDGFLITLNERQKRGPDQELKGERLSFQVGADGTALPQDYLLHLVTVDSAEVAIHLNTGTTVDTLGQSADNGYQAELAIDLRSMGYPPGLGDGALFLGVNLLDGDSFTPAIDSYGTRTWWYREYEGDCCPIWAQMHTTVTGVGDTWKPVTGFTLAGSFPNPARVQTIQYALPEPSRVTLHVFDIAGRLVSTKKLGRQGSGPQAVTFDGKRLGRGLYFYRLTMEDPVTDAVQARLTGRMLLLN